MGSEGGWGRYACITAHVSMPIARALPDVVAIPV